MFIPPSPLLPVLLPLLSLLLFLLLLVLLLSSCGCGGDCRGCVLRCHCLIGVCLLLSNGCYLIVVA